MGFEFLPEVHSKGIEIIVDVLPPFIELQNSMGRQVQGECYEPSHGPVPETTTWDEFYPADLEATTSPDASAIV